MQCVIYKSVAECDAAKESDSVDYSKPFLIAAQEIVDKLMSDCNAFKTAVANWRTSMVKAKTFQEENQCSAVLTQMHGKDKSLAALKHFVPPAQDFGDQEAAHGQETPQFYGLSKIAHSFSKECSGLGSARLQLGGQTSVVAVSTKGVATACAMLNDHQDGEPLPSADELTPMLGDLQKSASLLISATNVSDFLVNLPLENAT